MGLLDSVLLAVYNRSKNPECERGWMYPGCGHADPIRKEEKKVSNRVTGSAPDGFDICDHIWSRGWIDNFQEVAQGEGANLVGVAHC